MSLTPIYDDLMRELNGILEAGEAQEPTNDDRAAEQK
jgi:hypothetical protein